MSNIWSVYLFVCMSAFTNVYSFVVHFSAFVPFYLCLFLLLFFLYLSGENEKNSICTAGYAMRITNTCARKIKNVLPILSNGTIRIR